MGNSHERGTWRLIGLLFLLVIGGYFAIKVVGWLLGLLIPIAVVGAIGYGVYYAYGRKALGGGRRTLP